MLSRIMVVFLLASSASVTAQQAKQVSVESLLYDLKHPDADRRKAAAQLLGRNQIREAVPGLIEVTRDPDSQVRQEAGRALTEMRDPRALPAFIDLLEDPNRNTQLLAIDGIVDLYVIEDDGFLDNVQKVADFVNPLDDDFNPKIVKAYVTVDQDAVQALALRLGDSDVAVRRKAALAIGILRGRDALPEIKASLESEPNSGVRVELIRALYKIADREAAKVLIPLIRDDDKKVHDEAIYTLGRLRVKEAAPYLKELYEDGIEERRKILKVVPVSGKDDLQRNLFQALAYIGDPSCQELFLVGLPDERAFYRRYSAEGLARIGDPSVQAVVARAFIREKNVAIRLALSYALYRMGRAEHLEDLILNLDREQVDAYLMELNDSQIRDLYPYLESGPADTIASLLRVIGVKGDEQALEIARRYSQSENAQVLAAATEAIRQLQARGIS